MLMSGGIFMFSPTLSIVNGMVGEEMVCGVFRT
jgi:hypothetical protein